MAVIPPYETLTVEFKSDRKCLSDDDLIQALVCLANSEGGELWLGVEDDGTPTGLHSKHKNLMGLAGMVAARTSPALQVKVDKIEQEGLAVARILVPKARNHEVATSSGVYLQRRLKADGTPECVPLLPHDRTSRFSRLGLIDISAQPVANAVLDDFDPLERERLRQTIEKYSGDKVLLELKDNELDSALGLVTRNDQGELVPTLAGLLVIGRENALRIKVPTHEFAFQVLERADIRFNEFHRYPLLKALEWLETNFRAYNPEKEILVKMYRVPIPRVDVNAYREAVANAFIHRDYNRLGAVYIKLDDYELNISNAGGLMDGVTVNNLLTTSPTPRNPLLADIMKRVGLVERTGRGVDKIYRGMLRFGRPAPDYSHTTEQRVELKLATLDADQAFLRAIIQVEEIQGHALPVESLIVMAALREQKRLSIEQLAECVQHDRNKTKRIIEALAEQGFIEAHGQTRNRSYTLSAELYRAEGEEFAYTRQVGFSRLQHEQMILAHVQHYGSIKRADVIELCRVTKDQARHLLQELTSENKLFLHGAGRSSYYSTTK